MQHDDLEGMFADMRNATPAASEALMARVLADALQMQPQRIAPPPTPAARPGIWARIFGPLGGFPTVAGLCSVAVAGVIIGYSDPATLDVLTGGIVSDPLGDADLFSSSDFLAAEG